MRHLRKRLSNALERLPFGASVQFLLNEALQVLAVRVCGAALAYASMVLLARWLGAFQFGIYVYVSVLVMLLGIAMSFGLGASALRFIATYLARNKRARLAGFLRESHRLVLLFSATGTLVVAGCIVLLRPVIPSHYFGPLLLGMCCVPLWSLLNQLESTARAFGWLGVAYVPGYILRPLILLSGVGAVVLTTGSADANTALAALIASCAAALAVQTAAVYRRIRPIFSGSRTAVHSRYWMTISAGFLAIDGLRMLVENADLLLIGQLLDPHKVAVYYAVIRTGNLLNFITFAVTAPAVPKIAEIHSKGDAEELQAFVTHTIRAMFWPALLAAFALAAGGNFVLALFGPGFDAGYPALLIVLCGSVLRTSLLPAEHLLTMTGHHRETIKAYAGAAVAAVILNLWLIPALGLIGAAAASYCAILGASVYLFVRVRQRLGVNAFLVASSCFRPRTMFPSSVFRAVRSRVRETNIVAAVPKSRR